MTNIKFRLTINAITLAFLAHRTATEAVSAFANRSDSYFPSMMAMFVVVAFGAALSIADYIKKAQQ